MTYTIKEGLNSLISGESLSKEQSQFVMKDIMSGKANESLIAAFLIALRIRGETPDIIAGAALIMREFASRIYPKPKMKSSKLVDTCGTGGDNSDTFNISTIAAIIAAGAGVTIAKHGNRSVSSQCGSADLLEALGVNVSLEPNEVEEVINEIGIGFMFAPKFHPAMKYAMPARKGLATRTIFNILGPLTNPANASAHVLGVFEKELVKPMAQVMADLGAEHVYVVNSDPGIDEIVPINKVHISEVKNGEIVHHELKPKDFGMNKVEFSNIKGGSLDDNIRIAVNILKNKDMGIKRKISVINAAYAIHASGIANDIESAYEKAEDSLTSNKALEKLKELVEKSNGSVDKFNEIFN